MTQHIHELRLALNIIGDKWSALILLELAQGAGRFSTLQKTLRINNTTLTERLVSLTKAGLITKTTYQEYPPRIEYELTKKGQDLQPVLRAMAEWVKKYLLDDSQQHKQKEG